MPRVAPIAARHPVVTRRHGDTRIDDYAWLRERDNPEVQAHLRAENAHTQAWFAHWEAQEVAKGVAQGVAQEAPLRQRLYHEMLARIQEDDESVPWREHGWWTTQRTAQGHAYPSYWRWKDGADASSAELVLDLNELAQGKPYLDLGAFEISPDGRWLAYSLDESGGLDYTLRLKDLHTGSHDARTWADTDSVAWAQDSQTLFYVTKDEAKRTHRVWRHRLGQPPDQPDVLVFEERNELFWVDVSRTRDGAWIVVGSHSKDTSELRVINARKSGSRMRVIVPRRKGREASLDHGHGQFHLLLNDTGPNFRWVSVDARRPDLQRAQERVAHRPQVMLEDLDVFAHHAVLSERDAGVQRLRVFDLRTGADHTVAFDEPVYSAQGSINAEFDTSLFRLEYTSLVTPHTVYDYDMAGRSLTLRKRQPVRGGYEPSAYASLQLMAQAPDGTSVPVSLVWKPGVTQASQQSSGSDLGSVCESPPPHPRPLLLEGYGAYGIPNDVYFSTTRLSLLDRGVVVALAHVRGGADLGRTWYDDGKLDRKMNSFTDFIACAQASVDRGWTTHAQLIIEGGSAGGLLMGAVVNLRPDLCRAVVAEVPFVDVLNTMLDDSLPLTVGEYLEWGNPQRKADYATLRAYSPYDNLHRAHYPAMYLRCGLHDSQVPYWEAVKYAAKLRTLKTDEHPVLVSIDMEAGHAGASGRYEALKERAQTVAFMLAQWGLAHT